MAYQKLSPVTLVAAVQDKVETLTELRCYDYVPINEASPLYFAEITRIQPENSKTMYRDVEGQRYLKRNVDIQRPIYREDLIKGIRKEGG